METFLLMLLVIDDTHVLCCCGCQVLTQSSDSEQLGWWLARIKMTKGEFTVVEYPGIDQSASNEIVPVERVRRKNCKYVKPGF